MDGAADNYSTINAVDDRPPEAARPVPPSLRRWLVILVVAVLAPTMILSAGLMWSAADGANKSQERQLSATARAMALGLDRQLSEQIAIVRALSASRLLKAGDYESFYVQAREAIGAAPSWVVVRDEQGNQLMNTRLGLGEPLIRPQNEPSRATWAGSRDGVRVSNVFWGATARQPIVTVNMPIKLTGGRDGTLNVATYASTYTENLSRQNLPDGWVATILDGNNRIVARNRGGEDVVGRSATDDLIQRLQDADAFTMNSRNLEGVPTVVAVDRLTDLRWTVLIGVPRAEVTGFATRIIIVALLGGAALIAVSLLSAMYIASRIARPVETLVQSASDWMRGAATDFPEATGLKETDSLSASLREARHTVDDHASVQDLLINELNHRVKNTLATVQAIGRHSLRTAASAADFQQGLEGRVMAMSAAHELLTSGLWSGAELGELARRTLRPFAGTRLLIGGPAVQISTQDALNVSLALYELATNAAKHGALSGENGRVTLTWVPVGGGMQIQWQEEGGPAAPEVRRQGFGTRLIDRVRAGLSPSELTFAPSGVRCTLTVEVRKSPDGGHP